MATTLRITSWMWAAGNIGTTATWSVNFRPIRFGVAQTSLGRHRVLGDAPGNAAAYVSEIRTRDASGIEQVTDTRRAMLPAAWAENMSGASFQLQVWNLDATASILIFGQD